MEAIRKDTHRTVERAARESYGRLVAYSSSHTRAVASAEDALRNALVLLRKRILLFYEQLIRISWTLAGTRNGPEAELAVLDGIDPDDVSSYQPYWAVRATSCNG
jgi:predicted RNA polymerase sigma factor